MDLINSYGKLIFPVFFLVITFFSLLFFLIFKRTLRKDTRELGQFTLDRLIVPVLIGVLITVLAGFLKLEKLKEYLPDVILLFAVSFFVFLLYIIKDSFGIFNLKNRLEKANYVYNDLIDAHIQLPHVYPKFIDDRITEPNTQNGLVFINVQDDDYSTWLEECAANARHTLFTTLTGKYLPDFFFPKDHNKKYIEYIAKTNNFEIDEKIRIYIFPKEDFIKSLQKLRIDQIIVFFKNQDKFTKLYYLDKDKFIKEHLSSFADIHIAINCDFALFDNALAFRRIDDLELAYYFTNSDVQTLPCSFRKLFDKNILSKDCFLKLNVNEICKKTNVNDCIIEVKKQIHYD